MAVRYKLPEAPEAKVYLQEWRETKFATQQALSNIIKLPAPTISRYETGEREWGKGYLEALAFAVRCRVPDLFTPPNASADDKLRSALLAAGVHKDLLGAAMLAIEGFRTDSAGAGRSQSLPVQADTEHANPHRAKEPSR